MNYDHFDFAQLLDGDPLPVRSRGIAWHYTSADGLLGILANNYIWASAPQVLNDASEVLFGVNLVRETLEDLMSSSLPPRFHAYLRRVVDDSWIESIQSRCFVASASKEPDLLNQWRYYANADGFAVGFDIGGSWGSRAVISGVGGGEPVSTLFTPVVPGWHDVVYENDLQRKLARNGLLFASVRPPTASDDWLDRPEEWDELVGHTRLLLNTVPLTVKHSAFADERELRYIGGASNNEVRFRTPSGRIVPYTTVAALESLSSHDEPDRKFPVVEVVCGPGCRPGTDDIVRRALKHYGYKDVEIYPSATPLSL